jgi:hypothetical protein
MIEIDETGRQQHYAMREAQERLAALNSLDPVQKELHLALAARYAAHAARNNKR